MRQVVILAGGKGTRLRERLGALPKPLVDICGVPLLERQVLLAKKHHFTDVLILVNHAADYIIEYCAAKQNWGLEIHCIDDGQPLGTAGATLAVFDRLASEFLVMYGDTMLEVDLSRFHDFHRQIDDVSATLFLHPNDHPMDSDLVEMDDDGFITAFHPYPHDPMHFYPNLVNAALYWVRREALESWRENVRTMDFGKDLFPAMLRRGSRLRGFNSPEYIKDIGTPARLDKVCDDLRSGKITRSSLDSPQPVVFIDRDGTINREVDYLKSADEFELLPDVEAAIKHLNRSDYRCCVVTNQPVIARGELSFDELRQIHHKMETLLGRQGAFVDRIYYCPHHPHRGFAGERIELKIECDCRKPNTGMIERGIRELHGARTRSWLIGDTSVDIETARRAGLKSILVETGYAGLDYRHWTTPDATVPDLGAAVSYILDRYPRLLAYCQSLAKSIVPGDLVLLGGQARSGKSTFAAVLRDALHTLGRQARIISIDRWLKDEAEREPGVMGRYDMQALQPLIGALGNRERRPHGLTLPGYHKLHRKQVVAIETLPLSGSDVLIIEGTIALGLDIERAAAPHRYHIEIEEQARKQRVLHEYRLRGYSAAGAAGVYVARQSDEFPILEQLAEGATRISLSEIFR